MKVWIKNILLACIVPAIVLAAWIYVTTKGQISEGILPTVPDVWKTFLEIVKTGQLQDDLLISLSRVVKGYAVSIVCGILLGALIGMSTLAKKALLPIITVIRQIPVIAWIPLIILWFGIGEESKVVIIVIAAFFPILVNTESGIEQTPDSILEVAKLYKLSSAATFFRVYLPHALPNIFVGLRLGLGASWMAVVASELIAASSGIGYRMSDARSLMRADVVIVCMIVIGLIGVLMDKIIGLLFKLLTPWR